MSEPRNLGDIFGGHRHSTRIAVVDLYDPDQPREISFAELHSACDAVANGLRAAGLQRGDRIGVLALNRVAFLEAMFGTMRAGLVPVMINVKLPAPQVHYIVADSGAKIVFADAEFALLLPTGVRIVRFGAEFDAFKKPGAFVCYAPRPDDIAEQPYTSGSTGRPKGVLLTHAGQCWMIDSLVASRDMAAGDCSVISAPLYHKNALLAVKSALAPGGRVVLLARFDEIGRAHV